MNFKTLAVTALSTLIVAVSPTQSQAEVKLAPIFSDNMVLQRDKPIPVWGTAAPGEKVEVAVDLNMGFGPFGSKMPMLRTKADANGGWHVSFPPMRASSVKGQRVPYRLTVKGDKTSKLDTPVNLENIAIGDVYICSGQSNMEWPLAQTNNVQAEIAAANFPSIRLLTVPKKVAGTPQKEFAAATSWQVCTPQSVPGFSAVGYFFGRELNQKTGIPIGLINSSWGGTIAQAWMSKSTLIKRDDLRDLTLQTEKTLADNADPLDERMNAFWKAAEAGARQDWSTPAFDDAAWKTMKLPGAWEANGLPDFDGVVWFRQTIDIPAKMAGKDLALHLGTIDDRDTTYFNGEVVGEMNAWNQARVYKIPAALVKAGRATIAVRVLDAGGAGGFGSTQVPQLELADDANQKIVFAPEWKYQVSAALKDLPPVPSDGSGNPNQPAVLYNGMIAPLLNFPVRGAIWYQGESNADNPKQYQTLFPDLIRDWRTQWNAKQDGSEFGFYFVQLANYMARTDQPVEAGWAELREAQSMALSTPRVGMATIIDIGEGGNIHPGNKQDVGKRLALAALAKEYGQKVEYSGPTFFKMEMIPNTNRVRVLFTHGKGLMVKNAPPIVMAKIEGQEYPNVPLDFWAYAAINKLSKAGIIEQFPNGSYNNGNPMTRYEFAVAIARLLDGLQPDPKDANLPKELKLTEEQKNTLFVLTKEFEPELHALGVRIYWEEQRIVFERSDINDPPRLKIANPTALGAFTKGFAVRGEDGNWFWAQAHLDGDSVVLWSDEVLQPVAVRYAWANNPDVNLVNVEGLPAVPFRTDAP